MDVFVGQEIRSGSSLDFASGRQRQVIPVVAVGLWSVGITIGALKVILPVYFASVGVSVSKIALIFFFFKLSEVFAPLGQAATVNRLGYRKGFLGALSLHTLLSFVYVLHPTFLLIYFERFIRGLIGMRLLGSVYVKHYSNRESQRFHINLMLGMSDAAKGVGMLAGGVLIAVLPFELSILMLGLVTGVATLLALPYLPEMKESVKVPVLKIWGAVDRNVKVLGVARGFLLGAWDAWVVVILPVYLTVVFKISPALVGAIMMGSQVFHGITVVFLARLDLCRDWDPRRTLSRWTLLLIPVCLALPVPSSLSVLLPLIFVYQFLDAACGVYYNYMQLNFATYEKTSTDVAAYKTISNLFKPAAVYLSGVLAEALGFGWVFYFAALMILLSAAVCLALPRPGVQKASRNRGYAEEPLPVE